MSRLRSYEDLRWQPVRRGGSHSCTSRSMAIFGFQFNAVIYLRYINLYMEFLARFKEFIQKENLFQPKDKLLLAVSGGVDSVVLCALCKKAGLDFSIAHCNFNLRGADSKRDELFVTALAKEYGVNFFIKSFDTAAISLETKTSIEEAARNLRYTWFEEVRINNGLNYILTAHHADDNIETVLMNFFRGTGIKGLRGILPKKEKIIRPLLFARRSELEAFCQTEELAFVTDHTNAENDFTRNYFRNTILPLVSESYSEAKENILKNIVRFKETEILYRQAVDLHIKKLLEYRGNEVHIPVLKLIKTEPLATVFFEIIQGYGFTAHQVDEAISLLQSESGKYIQSATHRIIKNRNWIIIAPVQTNIAKHILIEETDHTINFETGALHLEKLDVNKVQLSTDNLVAMLDAATVSFPLLLRKWKQGDYFYPLGMKKKKKINRFLIDQKLSLPQKENTWVLEMDKKIIWVVGLRIDDRFKIANSTTQLIKISFNKSVPLK